MQQGVKKFWRVEHFAFPDAVAFQGRKRNWKAIFMLKKTISCIDPECNHGKGNILLVFHRESIFLRHKNPEGGYWEKITVRIPGINIDLSTAALTQKILPERFAYTKPILFDTDRVIAQCRNSHCMRWNEIIVKQPGIVINFADAAIVREDLPAGYHLDIEPAAVVIC
jgi:hypothetical protein